MGSILLDSAHAFRDELRKNNGTQTGIFAKLNDGILHQHVWERPEDTYGSASRIWKNCETKQFLPLYQAGAKFLD